MESEKTAVIAAGLMPKYIWLATGGKSGLNERLYVLRGRKVVAWPDVDGFQEWTDKLAQMTSSTAVTPGLTGSLDITVSPMLQQVATPEDLAAHIDIADWLIRCSRPDVDCHSEQSPAHPGLPGQCGRCSDLLQNNGREVIIEWKI